MLPHLERLGRGQRSTPNVQKGFNLGANTDDNTGSVAVAAAAAGGHPQAEAGVPTGGIMSKTLLLADDSVTIQKVVGISFANEDIQIVTVDNGDDAVSRAREAKPDVVLADVVMPGRSGYEVCEAIKAEAGLRHVPVLLLTGTFEAFDDERARQVGADGHITKPFEAQALVDQVNELLARAPAAAVAAASSEPAAAVSATTTEPELDVAPPRAGDASGDDAFDFFDDEAELAPATPEAEPATTAFELDAGESAFDFAPVVDDPGAAGSRSPEAATVLAPEPDPAPADATVAVAPEPALGQAGALDVGFEEGLDALEVSSGSDSGQDLDPLAASDLGAPTTVVADAMPDVAPAVPAAPAEAAADAFDFGFEDTGAASPGADPLADLEPSAASREALLDPAAAADFDVSSSDLGAPLAARPRRAEAEATIVAPALDLDPAPEPESVVPAAPLLTTPAAPAPRTEPAPSRPEVAPKAAETPDPAARLTPMMRDRLHDSLEKMAWEAFSDLPDRIVNQVVERVEAIAWEVIPQMAESLIREEIRRLKGEDE